MRKDWGEIEQKYIQGVDENGKIQFPTQRELASEYDISVGELGKKAKQGHWVDKKRKYLSKLRAECEQKSINKLSDEASQLNLKIFKAAEEGIEKIRENISNEDIDSLELERLSRTLLNLQRVTHLITGESTENFGDSGFFKTMLERRYQEWQNR